MTFITAHVCESECGCVDLQYQHLIPALNAWAARAQYTNASPIATQFPGHGRMNNLTTEFSFDSQATLVIDVIGLFFLHVIHWCFYDQALEE